jgi:hypothetical protein
MSRRYLFWSSISKCYFTISRSRALDLLDGPASQHTEFQIRGNDITFWAKGEKPK